jgi:hypothetical protein
MKNVMADPLHLNLWFPQFDATEILPRLLSVMRAFPYSIEPPGITYLSLHPISWIEPTILEQQFRPSITPEEAVLLCANLLHEDHAYVFEACWDLWMASPDGQESTLQPSPVRFIAHGLEFDDAVYEQAGHIQIDFGLDSPFLQEQAQLTREAEERVRANVHKLVQFINQVEQNCGASARLLWSESEENFAQKLIGRLQKIQ